MSQSILHHQQFGESGDPLIAIHGLFGSLENLGVITDNMFNAKEIEQFKNMSQYIDGEQDKLNSIIHSLSEAAD